MSPFDVLAGAAGGSLPPITGGHAGPSGSDLQFDQALAFSSPFAVGSGATATSSPATNGGGSPVALWLAAGAAVVAAVLLLRRG